MAVLAVAKIDVARIAAFHPERLRNRFRRNRIKRIAAIGLVFNTVALVGILKLHRLEIGIGDIGHDRVRHAVDRVAAAGVAAKVRMQCARPAIVYERYEIP